MGMGTSLAAFLEGFQKGDQNLLQALEVQATQKQKLLEKLMEEQDKQEGLQRLAEEKQKGLLEKIVDMGVSFIGDHGMQLSNYGELAESELAISKLVEGYLKKHKLPKNEKQRKLARNYLKSLSPEELEKEVALDRRDEGNLRELISGNKNQLLESSEAISDNNKKSFEENHPFLHTLSQIGSDVKDFVWRNPFDMQTHRDNLSTLAKTPGRWGKMLMEVLGSLDEKMQQSREQQGMTRISPSIKEELAPSIEKMNEVEGKIEKALGSSPDAKGQRGAELLIDLALPAGRVARGGKLLPRIGKNALTGAGYGGAYGALYSGGDPDAITSSALLGGIFHSAAGLKGKKPHSKKKLYEKIAEDADNITLEQAQARAKILGEEALIPEIVGSENFINQLKQDISKGNKQRLREMQKNIKQSGQKAKGAFVQGEQETLYSNLTELKNGVWKAKDHMYDLAKGEGYLSSRELKEFYRAVSEAHHYTKGLPQFKPRKGNVKNSYLKELKELIESHPLGDNRGYKEWYARNEMRLPTAEDFIEYKSRIGKALESDPGNNALINLQQSMEEIVDKTDKGSFLTEADRFYATHAAPFKAKKIKEAIHAVNLKQLDEAPSVTATFGKSSPSSNARIFRQLSSEDKRRVIGSLLDEVIGGSGMRPDRAIMKLWKELPDYIKKTEDKGLQEIFQEMQVLAGMDKTLSSLQQSTTESIASRQNIEKASRLISRIGYASSLAGGLKSLGIFAGAKLGMRAKDQVRKKQLIKPLKQKHLKDYFDRDLLEEIEKKRRLRVQTLTQKREKEK